MVTKVARVSRFFDGRRAQEGLIRLTPSDECCLCLDRCACEGNTDARWTVGLEVVAGMEVKIRSVEEQKEKKKTGAQGAAGAP